MQHESVTVLIPVYNAEKYLEETLKSVSVQTLDNFEILVIDDGSTDRSPEILAEYQAIEPRLKVIRQRNSGISAALNTGIDTARGTLIARMDADDVMLPHRLERQRDFLEEHQELGFCASFMDMIDSEGRVFGEYCPGPLNVADLERQMAKEQPITYTHPTVMYRTELVSWLGGYDPKYEPCEDMELFGRMILAGFPGMVVPEKLLRYRVHGTSISGSKAGLQVRIRDYVRRDFYARRSGGVPLPRAEFERWMESLDSLDRLAYDAQIRSEACRQIATYCRAERRWAALLGYTAAAALLRPVKAIRYAAAKARGLNAGLAAKSGPFHGAAG
jgi:glycosyltransferase involved in cell wall biosynthesis